VNCYLSKKPDNPSVQCLNGTQPSRANNQHRDRNIAAGAATGGVATGGAAVIAIVVLNVFAFPEAEGIEALLLALSGEPLMTGVVVGVNGAAYGGLAGGVAGFAATQPNCGGG
jgi:hypothetical protein